MDKTQKCTRIRIAWTVFVSFITATGAVFIFDLKQYYIGVPAVLIGVGIFFYKMKTWKKEDES